MSHYVPQMDRNGTQWPKPVGTWKKGQDISHLATLAEKMDVADDRMDTDLLNSVPTPWARLLLFENALYNPEHPSHHDILDQWRGLLGVIALAAPLRIALTPGAQEMTVDLRDLQPHNRIAKTFLDLRPRYRVDNSDVEQDKWSQFHLIAVEGTVLGATSPRTLVFTGISHQCPPSIPFRSSRRRLSDPVLYYRRFGDTHYLSLLKHWLSTLIAGLTNNQNIINLLGTFPSPPGVQPDARHPKLIALLQSWLNEMAQQPVAQNVGQLRQLFTLLPYDSIKGLPAIPPDNEYESDLLLNSERGGKTVIGFHPGLKSFLLNQQGDPVQNESLKISDGRWMRGNEELPNPLYFLPQTWACINDPVAAFFEDRLIEVALPATPTGVYVLNLNQKNFLYPFKREILSYLSPEEVAENTTINVEADSGYTIRLRIPLVNGRSIEASRYYSAAKDEITWNLVTADLAAWPDFSSSEWHHYFYFKRRKADKAEDEIDFAPINAIPSRAKDSYEWYSADAPVEAFIGTNRGKHGLLLLKYEKLGRIESYWKVSVDFGSTHTRAFRLLVNPPNTVNAPYSTASGAGIEPVNFTAHACALTASGEDLLRSNFFPLSGTLEPASRAELKTLLMQPVSNNGQLKDWLPREGFIYMHWILDGYDPDRLKYDIKWEGGNNQHALSAYLRCLMIMIQAEAAKEGAKVVSVSRSYPSSFSKPLEAEHDREWTNLGNNLGLTIEPVTLLEAVATCRYLEYEEHAKPISNAISMDVGGSTTDVAIWAGKYDEIQKQKVITLEIQESVKMAAGVISQYLNSQSARPFLIWFEQRVKENNVERFSFNAATQRRLNPGLMFNNLLSFFELGDEKRQREFSNLLGQLQAPNPGTDNSAKQEGVQGARIFMSHLIFLFGGLIYYVGLLVRKINLPERGQNNYNIYFCGKGGKLIQWIPGYKELVRTMFEAGLYGPDGSAGKPAVSITLNISKLPKQEVGRGLLTESVLMGNPREEGFGLMDILPPSVTVGETGYPGLQWDGSLDGESLQKMQEHPMPEFDSLRELKNFIQTIRPAFEKKGQPPTLNFASLNIGEYMQQLEQRFFSQRPGQTGQSGAGELIEPLFITELKVLLEILTDNPKLFS